MQALAQRPSRPASGLGAQARRSRRATKPGGAQARAQRFNSEGEADHGAGGWRSLLGAAALAVILKEV